MPLSQNTTHKPSLLNEKASKLPFEAISFDLFYRGDTAGIDEGYAFSRTMLDGLADRKLYIYETSRNRDSHAVAPIVRKDGVVTQPAINFASYDFLALGSEPSVLEAAKAALDQYGLGSAGSPILSGNVDIHEQLEANICEFLGPEGHEVTLFPTGFSANTGTIASVLQPEHACILDAYSHASIMEGAKLSGARIYFFRHNDMDHLKEILGRIATKYPRILICVDALYSVSGDFAPLKSLISIAKEYDALTLVDEAHSMLVAGPGGRGVAVEAGVLEDIDFLILTLSKAFGGVGGAVYAKRDLLRYIRWFSRVRMFSCSLPPAVAAGLNEALRLAQTPELETRRQALIVAASGFRTCVRAEFDIGASESWIIPVLYGQDSHTLRLVDNLQRKGLHANPIQYPAAPKGSPRLRFFVTSCHTEQNFQAAIDILREFKSFFL